MLSWQALNYDLPHHWLALAAAKQSITTGDL
jgi:hypothetical protein